MTAVVRTAMIGDHHLHNCLMAAAVGLAEGIDLPTIVRGLENVTRVPGRLERIECGQPFGVYVDYAHTPDALAVSLDTLREVTAGRLICVFGAGGNRDTKKRPLMGRAVEARADVAIVTADNPRHEDPAAIAAEIIAGCERPGDVRYVPDRTAAIHYALSLAGPDDCVLVAGRGHEPAQTIGSERVPLDDREAARRYLYNLEPSSRYGGWSACRTHRKEVERMHDVTVGQLHEIVGGRLRLATLAPRGGEQARVGNVAIDSRQVRRGDIFWGLPGTRFDGSQFANEAYSRGAEGAVVGGRYVQPWPGCWSLEVEDAQRALEQLAVWNRQRHTGRVVAVTGSVGKTTTRQMIRAVLERRYCGTASPKNYNNHVGVPLSLLALKPHDDFAVLELAASGPGEIETLAALCRPHIGVITRVGDAHLGGFGSLDGVASAKTELLATLPAGGYAVLAGDDARLRRCAAGHPGKIIWYGRGLENDLVATHVESREGRLSFEVDGTHMSVAVWGRHHLDSALAAVAVGRIFGLRNVEISRGLCEFEPPPMRCQITAPAA